MTGGIPPGAVEFFAELAANNTREWWKANERTYRDTVRAPFESTIAAIDPTLNWRIYRPHRDVRFARDKTPYKDFIGAVAQRPSGNGHFIKIDQHGLLISSGYPMMAKDQLERFRTNLDDTRSAEAFVEAIRHAEREGVVVTPGRYEPLKQAPRGYRNDHPHIGWLRAKGVEIPQKVGTPAWLHTIGAADEIRTLLRLGHTVTDWLDNQIGPSNLTPEEIWGR